MNQVCAPEQQGDRGMGKRNDGVGWCVWVGGLREGLPRKQCTGADLCSVNLSGVTIMK